MPIISENKSVHNLRMKQAKQLLTDSKMAPVSPMLPLGVTPSPPISPAHKSLDAHSIRGQHNLLYT